ncbi:hypothetical protein [Rubripirellula amarantea]|uniref:hypothetical protein n=1 Tax=Rubripirellula amarantea TaxID=2527999 RepID=UPI001A948959|nr:hypothetical protein [Rubripirellula amarantea]
MSVEKHTPADFAPMRVVFEASETAACKATRLFRMSVPFASGSVSHANQVGIRVGANNLRTQVKVLQRWPDGSIQWCSIVWTVPPDEDQWQDSTELVAAMPMSQDPPITQFSIESCGEHGLAIRLGGVEHSVRFRSVDSRNNVYEAAGGSFEVLDDGPICKQLLLSTGMRSDTGIELPLLVRLFVSVYPDLSTAVFRVTVQNPRPAGHPDGNWDLGNAGSLLLRDLSFVLSLPTQEHSKEEPMIRLDCGDGKKLQGESTLNLFQASSGGANWHSRNHLNKDREIPLAFRGYRANIGENRQAGLRAKPQVVRSVGDSTVAIAMRAFWENFPKCIRVNDNSLQLGLFPEESGSLHELQGGEQKTHEFAIFVGEGKATDGPLDWYTSSCRPSLSPGDYVRSQAIPFLTSRSDDPNTNYHDLVDSAIVGPDSFFAKRELIDEYGWRHYGDIYGDHEAIYHEGEGPMISHYNNQYDCTWAFAIHFMRTGDSRWFDQMVAMADHAWDIDTYHTDEDKNLYNGGLFWHTYHYADADTGTHRSYPRHLKTSGMKGGKDLKELGSTGKKLAQNYGVGGGPSASQNYPTGWMYAYFLTGELQYRDAAINAADYVMRIEDGTKTVFRWLSRSETGLSIESGAGYHGPGRASANSLHALMTGYELTQDQKYLDYARKLIMRVIHPEDNIEKLDLLNAELRWFYTMFLQALTRYIDLKAAIGENDSSYAFAVDSLNHYALWMTNHEVPTLSNADRLQYPSETWAAQDMRKWHILEYAAWLNQDDSERHSALRKKSDFFFNYVCSTLHTMPSRTLCRPVILIAQFGWQWSWFRSHRASKRLPTARLVSHPPKQAFTPQRQIALRRAKLIALSFGGGLIVTLCFLLVYSLITFTVESR